MKIIVRSRSYSILITFLLICSSCTSNKDLDHNTQIQDVTKSQKITLSIDKKRNTHGLSIKLTGYLNGNATVKILSEEGLSESYELRSGSINKAINVEWYNENCWLEYIPTDVKDGTLAVLYEFDYIR